MVKRLLSIICVLSIMLANAKVALAEEYSMEYIEECAEEYIDLPECPTGGAVMNISSGVLDDTEYDGGISFFSQTESATEEDIYLFLVDAIENRDLTQFTVGGEIHYGINLFGFNVPVENKELIGEAFRRAFLCHPELLIYNKYTYWSGGGVVIFLEITYMFDAEEEQTQRTALLNVINEYVELAEAVPDTVGKLLVVHDELSSRCRYATAELASIKENGIQDIKENLIYTGYGAFINNIAVCQGYAIALRSIFERLGIENVLCRNDDQAVNHIWNMVKIDGEWYNIDVTWDDSDTKDSNGNLMTGGYHDWFLVTDAKNVATGHGAVSDWEIVGDEKDISCTSTKYENGYIFRGEHIYYNEAEDKTINYGGWYGNISYEENRYKIDVMFFKKYSSEKSTLYRYLVSTPGFYSNGVESYGVIATQPYQTTNSSGETVRVISYFTNCDISGVDLIAAKYENGTYLGKSGGSWLSSVSASLMVSLNLPSDERKIMLWKSGTQEPVAEARSTN